MKTTLLLIIIAALGMPCAAQLALIRQGRDSVGNPEPGDWHGAAVALGDFDGDGYDDLAAGAPFESSEPSSLSCGSVIVSPGTPWGLTWKDAFNLSPLDGSLETSETHQMGKSLAAGDFNNDGYDDLAVGLPASAVNGQPGAGRVFIYYGSPGGLGLSASIIHQGMLAAAVESGDNFGASLAAGKLGDDGFDDLAIGATGENDGRGAVFVIRGGALGLNNAQRQVLLGEDLGMANVPDDHFGYAVLIANVIGFPAAELIVGAPFAELTQGVPSSGLVYIANSTNAAVSTTGTQVLSAQNMGDTLWFNGHFGYALAAGNLWGDGVTLDLAIGAPGSHAGGRVYIGRGSPLGMSWPLILAQPAGWGPDDAGDEFGAALATGDHDSDDDDELAVGCPGQDVVLAFTDDSGSIHIYDGSAAGPVNPPTSWLDFDLGDEVTGEGRLGYALASGHTSTTTRRSFCAGAPRKFGDTGQVFDVAPWRQVMRPLCRSALAADCENNVVYALRPFDELKIASTTKTMTALLACEATQRPPSDPLSMGLQDTYTIESWMFEAFPLNSGCSIFGFPPAPVDLLPQTHTLQDLLHACIFPSGNDACYAIADAITGEIDAWSGSTTSAPQFVEMMNERAESLQMHHTHFTNPAGTDGGNPYSTAYDMWLLSRAAMANELFRSVASATDYPITRVLLGSEAGIFQTVNTNLSYGWLKDLKAIDSRMTGIKPGGTPGAGRTGVAAGRYDAAGTKLAFATAFRFADGETLNSKIVALTQLALSFCNTDIEPVGGVTGPLGQSTWNVNDGRLQAIQWGGFDGRAEPAAGERYEWIELDHYSLGPPLARYPLHWHYRGLWELPPGESVTLSVGPMVGASVTLRLLNEFSVPPPSTAQVALEGSAFPSGQTIILFANQDGMRATGPLAPGNYKMTLRNTGNFSIWISGAFRFDAIAEGPRWGMSFVADRASMRSGHTVSEGLPASPTDPQGLVEIIVQDRTSGLRFLPPFDFTRFSVRPGSRPGTEDVSFSLVPGAGTKYFLPDFLDGVEIQASNTLGGGWQVLDRLSINKVDDYTWRGTLPSSARRFFRAVGIPAEE